MKVLVRNISVFEDEEVFQTFYQKMPEERQRKIDCCARWKDKRLSLAAGVLLQEMLQEYGVDDANLRIGYGEVGCTKEEGGGETMDGTVGREEKKRGSNRKSTRGTGRHEGSSRTVESSS